jgi:hypothetical protein
VRSTCGGRLSPGARCMKNVSCSCRAGCSGAMFSASKLYQSVSTCGPSATRKAHVGKDRGAFLHHLADRMDGAARARAGGQGDIQPFGAQPRVQRGILQRGLAGAQRRRRSRPSAVQRGPAVWRSSGDIWPSSRISKPRSRPSCPRRGQAHLFQRLGAICIRGHPDERRSRPDTSPHRFGRQVHMPSRHRDRNRCRRPGRSADGRRPRARSATVPAVSVTITATRARRPGSAARRGSSLHGLVAVMVQREAHEASPSQIRRRIEAEFSPIPPVKTIASTPPIAAA